MNALVVGGTGTVGSQVVSQLVERGADVSVLTRDPGRAANLPEGVKVVQGDLLDPSTVRSVFTGRDGVFLLNAVSPTEAHEGLMATIGLREARVGRVVYLSVHHADQAPHLPHFGAKLPIEAAIRQSGIPYTILRPNNYYQNDHWYQQALLEFAVYPQPLGSAGCSRVDVRDIAEVAAKALTTADLEGETINLVGPEAVTGAGTAATWSEVLGKPVAYAGEDMDAWEEQTAQYLPPALAFDFRHMFEHFQRHGLLGTAEDVERLTVVLGRPPRSFADFASETAKAWS